MGKPAVVGVDQLAIFDHHAELGGFGSAKETGFHWTARPARSFPVWSHWRFGSFRGIEDSPGLADDVRRGHLKVRANADTNSDAKVARDMGAEGIGLCRTEHMFLNEDRLPIVRRMILADNPSRSQRRWMNWQQCKDGFLFSPGGHGRASVTVRLLDPPLHEFLHRLKSWRSRRPSNLDEYGRDLLVAARTWRETNPMLGTRGVR